MQNPNQGQSQNLPIEKEILAFLNAKPDTRATTKELIENIKCPAKILRQCIIYLNRNYFIDGPILTEKMINDGGDNSLRMSITLTEKGQEHFVDIIKQDLGRAEDQNTA